MLPSVGSQSVGRDWATEKHSPLVTISLISRSVSLFLLCNKVHVYHFLNFYLCIIGCAESRLLCVGFVWSLLCVGFVWSLLCVGFVWSLLCVGFSLQRLLLLWSTASRGWASVVVAYGLSCPVACGIFPDQGWKNCPLLWQADS